MKNEINITYKINKENEYINIFGEEFVENNNHICKYIYDNKEYELSPKFDLKRFDKSKDILEIKLTGIKNITNMSDLFNECNSLSSLTDLSKWNTKNINNMSFIFYNCNNLESLPDISKWNTENVINMSGIFGSNNYDEDESVDEDKYRSKYKLIPDISKWNTINVKYLGGYYKDISSLSPLTNYEINKMIENKEEFISGGMFENCYSLSSLPDISKWNTNNVTNMSYLFSNCSSLSSLPDISKWNINNLEDYSDMFDGCDKNLIIPEKFKN